MTDRRAISRRSRSVAQPGSASDWGSGGRGFKSRRSDHFSNRYETPDLVIPVGSLFQARGERALGIPLEARLDRMVAVGETGLMLSVYIVQLNVVGLQAGIDWYTSVLGSRVSKENNFLHHGTTVQLEHDKGFRLILHNAR